MVRAGPWGPALRSGVIASAPSRAGGTQSVQGPARRLLGLALGEGKQEMAWRGGQFSFEPSHPEGWEPPEGSQEG